MGQLRNTNYVIIGRSNSARAMVFAVYRLKTKEKNILNRSQISILYNRYIVFRFSQYPGCEKQNENSVYKQLYRIRCFDRKFRNPLFFHSFYLLSEVISPVLYLCIFTC